MFELMDVDSQNAVIKVIGVGGGGGNAVNHMLRSNIEGSTSSARNRCAGVEEHRGAHCIAARFQRDARPQGPVPTGSRVRGRDGGSRSDLRRPWKVPTWFHHRGHGWQDRYRCGPVVAEVARNSVS